MKQVFLDFKDNEDIDVFFVGSGRVSGSVTAVFDDRVVIVQGDTPYTIFFTHIVWVKPMSL